MLEYKTHKPIANAQIRYFYKAHSKNNTTPILAGLDHRSTTHVCYASFYTETNDKGEFAIPPLPKNIKLLNSDDQNRLMVGVKALTFYHPNYIILQDQFLKTENINATAYPMNNPKIRYQYLSGFYDSCNKTLSSPQKFNVISQEIDKLREQGIVTIYGGGKFDNGNQLPMNK